MTALERLYLISVIEGTTLLVLLLIAVPLKHLAHLPMAVTVMGPIHGLVFCMYIWTVLEAVSAEHWSRRDALRLSLAALVPFGSFANARYLHRRARTTSITTSH